MDYLIAFGIAWGFSFVGMLPPGMLNMTTIGLSMKKGFYPALWFAVGAAIIEFGQALMVIKFSIKAEAFLTEYESIVNWVAVVVLIALALSFLLAKPKKDNTKVDENLKEDKSTLLKGMTLAFANVLVYPFWLAQGIVWTQKGVLDGSWSFSIVFSIGVFLGSVTAYLVYIILGEKILSKFDAFANNLNKILAALFFFLAILQLAQIFLK